MNETEKTVWIDERDKIVSFHKFDNGEMITVAESMFWDFLFRLITAEYRVM